MRGKGCIADVAVVVVCSSALACSAVSTPSPARVIPPLADHLAQQQVQVGDLRGSWPGEEAFTGMIVCGLTAAYAMTCDDRYRDSAESGAEFLVNIAGGNLYGDEAYALTCLSEVTRDMTDDRYLPVVSTFYDDVKEFAKGGTAGCVLEFAWAEPSSAVFYLANHAVAAYRVHAEDRQVWREGLIDHLRRVDDSSASYPVAALGIATWALALTGPLDDRLLGSSWASAYWHGKRLSDLPRILMDHQVGGEGPLPGSFYWRFDCGDGGSGGPPSGYIEDLVFAALGLSEARKADLDLDGIDTAVRAARVALLNGLHGQHVAPQHLWLTSGTAHLYAGEALLGLSVLVQAGDLDLDGHVAIRDFSWWASRWRESCLSSCACRRADFDGDGQVAWADLAQMTQDWLR